MFHKYMKGFLAAAAASSMLLAGCAGKTVVTEDTAPEGILKQAAAINAESSSDDIIEIFTNMITKTAEDADYHLKIVQKTTGHSLSADESGISTENVVLNTFDVRSKQDGSVYEFFEQTQGDSSQAGVMEFNPEGTKTIYGTIESGTVGSLTEKINIETIDEAASETDEEYTDEELEEVYNNTIIYPLYTFMGQNLILSPMINPEYYNWTMEKQGSDYIWTISMKDAVSYNEALDEFISENYGVDRTDLNGDGSVIADVYETTDVSLVLTLDENGVIKKILNQNLNLIGDANDPLDVNSVQTTTLSAAGEEYQNLFTNLFKAAADGKLAQGDTFALSDYTK